MILVIGGYAQGKRRFCEERFPGRDLFVLDGSATNEDIDGFMSDSPDGIVISDEIGCGVVPIEKRDRELVERVGRMQIETAKRSDEVWRVVCGQGTRIK